MTYQRLLKRNNMFRWSNPTNEQLQHSLNKLNSPPPIRIPLSPHDVLGLLSRDVRRDKTRRRDIVALVWWTTWWAWRGGYSSGFWAWVSGELGECGSWWRLMPDAAVNDDCWLLIAADAIWGLARRMTRRMTVVQYFLHKMRWVSMEGTLVGFDLSHKNNTYLIIILVGSHCIETKI